MPHRAWVLTLINTFTNTDLPVPYTYGYNGIVNSPFSSTNSKKTYLRQSGWFYIAYNAHQITEAGILGNDPVPGTILSHTDKSNKGKGRARQ